MTKLATLGAAITLALLAGCSATTAPSAQPPAPASPSAAAHENPDSDAYKTRCLALGNTPADPASGIHDPVWQQRLRDAGCDEWLRRVLDLEAAANAAPDEPAPEPEPGYVDPLDGADEGHLPTSGEEQHRYGCAQGYITEGCEVGYTEECSECVDPELIDPDLNVGPDGYCTATPCGSNGQMPEASCAELGIPEEQCGPDGMATYSP